jgi:peroxiredoxin
MKTFFPLLRLAGIFLLLAAGRTTAADQPSAPASQPPDARSAETALADFLKKLKLRDQPVMIEFGMVGCELSEKGLDAMAELKRNSELKGLAFVRVESSKKCPETESYYEKKALPFPLYYDGDRVLGTAADATAIPTFVLVDKFGHVRYRGTYPEQVVPWAKTLIAEEKDPGADVALFGAKTLDIKGLLADTKLPDLKETTKPLADYMGTNGLVVIFVDTKCPYSIKAMAELPSVVKVLRERQIASVLLNVDDPRKAVESFYAKRDVGASVVYDAGSGTRKSWNVNSVPTVILIKGDQTLTYTGKAVWSDLGSAIEKSLNLAAGTVQFSVKGTRFG